MCRNAADLRIARQRALSTQMSHRMVIRQSVPGLGTGGIREFSFTVCLIPPCREERVYENKIVKHPLPPTATTRSCSDPACMESCKPNVTCHKSGQYCTHCPIHPARAVRFLDLWHGTCCIAKPTSFRSLISPVVWAGYMGCDNKQG